MPKIENPMREKVIQCRRKGVPETGITTVDEYVLEGNIALWLSEFTQERNGGVKPGPIVGWDCVRSIYGINEPGKRFAQEILQSADISTLLNPVDFLMKMLEDLPNEKRNKEDALVVEGGVLVMRGLHRYLTGGSPPLYQVLTNLRDPFKNSGRMLILISPDFQMPLEVSRCFHFLDEPMPTEEERLSLVVKMHEDNGMPPPAKDMVPQINSATRGLSLFSTEQSVALATKGGKIEQPLLWARWRKAVNSVAGLQVDESGLTLEDVGGLDAMKDFALKLMRGRNPPDAIVRIEEIEKALAGSGSAGAGDTSGVSQSILQYMLTWMQEEKARGLIAVGPPGAGKSLCSVTIGSAGPVPTITFDLGAVKGSYVGESERNMRDALKTIKAMAKRVFVVASCNSEVALPAELKRRFRSGIWYFDLPTKAEREVIWRMYLKKYKLDPKQERPADEGWTGAEIDTCCYTAWDFNTSLLDAAKWIVPVCRTAKELIENLRNKAEGRWLSATTGGAYTRPASQAEAKGGRRMDAS